MLNRAGRYIEQQRRSRNLTRGQLARMAGYENVSSGGRRITEFERDGVLRSDLVDRIVRALQLDDTHIRALLDEDRETYAADREHWLNEPIAPELRFRPIPSVWCGARLEPGISKDDAIAYAKQRAGTTGWTHFLRWSRRQGWWVYPSGLVGEETNQRG